MSDSEAHIERVVDCPKCGGRMETGVFRTIAIDRCKKCFGLWFDSMEAEWLKEEVGSDVIDEAARRALNQQVDKNIIDCPVCHVPMIRMVDPKQPHIWFEKCANCFGIFFDAGEFKDYKDFTVEDFLKRFSTPERKY